MKPVRVLVLVFIVCAISYQAAAQTDTIPMTRMDEILIKSPYHPPMRAIRLLDLLAIDTLATKRMQSRNLSDLLSRTTGIFVKNYGPANVSAITVRGMSAAQTRITWNGMDINSPMYGMADLNLIPLAAFSKAQVLPAGNAIGGMLDLVSDHKDFEGLSVSGMQSVESFSGRYSHFSAKYGKTIDTILYGGQSQVYYRTARNNYPFINNARFGSPEEQQTNASTEMYGFTQEFYRTKPSGARLHAIVWGQHNFRELPPPLTSANNRETQEDNSLRGAIKYVKYVSGIGRIYANGGVNIERLNYDNLVIGLHTRSKSAVISGALGNEFYKSQLNYRTELGFQHARASEGRYFGEKSQSTIQGFFSVDNFRYKLRLTLRPQLVDFSHLLPNICLAYGPQYAWRKPYLTAAIKADFKYPTLNDLYWNPGGNDSLKPERAYGQEVAFNYSNMRFLFRGEADLKFTLYSIYAFDFIQWQPADASYWQAQNLNQVWSRGFEASAKFRKPALKGLLLWNNSFNYTRVSTQKPINPTDKSVGRQLIYVPRFIGQSSLQYEHKSVYAGAYYTYTDYRRTPDGYLRPYQLVDIDLGVQHKWRQMEANLSFRVNNILNESYQVIVWRPMPGRWYSLTLNVTWTKKKQP